MKLADLPSGLSHLAYGRLVSMIGGSEWAEGGRLPAEAPLAEGLGVSRGVLRRALARLREEGRITSRRGSGNYVVPQPAEDREASGLAQIPIRAIEDLTALTRFRRVVEVAAAVEAAANADVDDIARIETAIDAFRRSMPGAERFDHDLKFHLGVARASRNIFFLATMEGLQPALRKGHRLSRQLRDVPINEVKRVADEHTRVLDAIRAHDPDAARTAMSAHLDAGLMRLFENRTQPASKPKDTQ